MARINFSTFEAEHGPDLKKYIRSVMLGEYESQYHEDIWSEMMLRLVDRDRDGDRPPIRKPKSVAFFILRTVIGDFIRKRRQEAELFVDLAEDWQHDRLTLGMWEKTTNPEEAAIFKEAILNLSPRAAMSFAAYEEGLSVREEARAFFISERTVGRNRQQLRTELQEALA